VSAGQCLSASAFVSTAAFQSRQASYNALPCLGMSPTEWVQRAPYWPGGLVPGRKFHQEFGTAPLSPGLPASASLLDVLNAPGTIEAHVTAALLNAHRGGMTAPFDSPVNIAAIWANIHTHGGYFQPVGTGTEQPAMTPQGTLQWIALTWSGSGMSGTLSSGGTGTGTTSGTGTGSTGTGTGNGGNGGNGNGNGNAYGKYK
jgi:hypothetical protein